MDDDGSGELAPEWPAIVACGTNESQYSPVFGREICERTAMGDSLAAICRSPGMPHRTTVRHWLDREPGFARALRAARRQALRDERAWYEARRAVMSRAVEARAGGPRRGSASTYTEAVGDAVCRRIAAGESVKAICASPGMPCAVTIYAWIKRHPEFREMYRTARELQADGKFDEAWEIAQAATPSTVRVARLRFDVILWQAARLAPRKYAERLDEDLDERPPLTVIIRRFGEDGRDEGESAERYDA
jgi:hypothetical protein